MRKYLKLNNKKGMSLLFVILVMLVLSILSVAIFTLFTSNLRMAQQQQNHIRAHYLAISGVEVAFASLTKGDTNVELVNTYFNKPINVTVSPINDSFELDGGEVDVTVSSFIEEGNRWVLITSVGTLNDGTDITRSIEMRFRVEYPEIQIWN